MPSKTVAMPLADKIIVTISILSLVVSFVALALSESVVQLGKQADVIAFSDTVNLSSLVGLSGHISTLKVLNRGNAASKDVKIVIKFSNELPKYEISSDEDTGRTEIVGNTLKISLDRLSSNSNLKITMYSANFPSYNVNYIDDNGNSILAMYSERSGQKLFNLILVMVIVSSLLMLVWVFRRAAETDLIATLESHQGLIEDRFRELRDDISNIDVSVDQSERDGEPAADDKGKGYLERLTDLVNKSQK